MAIDRWSPFGEMMTLRDAMDRLLQDSYVRPGSGMVTGARTAMPLDVVENDNDYVVYASMPGVKPQNVQITVQGDTLTIRGEASSSINEPQGQQAQGQQAQGQQGQQGQGQNQQGQNGNYLMRERKQATYFRQVTLPTNVNADKANARFEHGELILTLPKAEEAKPKQIRVQAQPEQGQIQASSQHGQTSQHGQSSQHGQQSQTQQQGTQTQHIRPKES